MEWSPEIIIAIGTALSAIIAVILQKTGKINLPMRRKWTAAERGDKVVNHNQRPECADSFKILARKIDMLEEGKTRNETNITNQEKMLIKGEKHFEKLEETMTDFGKLLAAIGIHIEYLVKSEKKKNGGSHG